MKDVSEEAVHVGDPGVETDGLTVRGLGLQVAIGCVEDDTAAPVGRELVRVEADGLGDGALSV